jgi:hypothetical protein
MTTHPIDEIINDAPWLAGSRWAETAQAVPSRAQVVERHPNYTAREVERCIEGARAALSYRDWKRSTVA